MMPTAFSSSLISNLVTLGGFTEKDKWGVSNTNGIAYFNSSNRLRVSFAAGEIDFERELGRYNGANLAKNVPGTNQLFRLTKDFLPKLELNSSEIQKTKWGRLMVHCSEPSHTQYFVNDSTVTNVEFRRASFRRLIDGMVCDPYVGSCTIDFGAYSQIQALSLYWRSMKRDKLFSAATPDEIVRWIRQGKAILPWGYYAGMSNTMPIDWSTVKKVTIKEAAGRYWGEFFFGEREHRPVFPSPIVPYATLQAIVDTGTTNVNIGITCPIIDEKHPISDSEETSVRPPVPH